MQWILRAMTPVSGEAINLVVDDYIDESQHGEDDHGGIDDPVNDPEADQVGIVGALPMTFDDLFNWVTEAIDKADLSSSVSVGMSQGRLHIRFDSDIMFAPDSSELLPTGRAAINAIAPGIQILNDYIASVEVAGHTAALPGGARVGVNDWSLSSNRAVTVTNYLDFGISMVDSEKFQTAGFAQYHPYMSNEREETRARNRRVELVVARNDFMVDRTQEVIDMLHFDYELGVISGGDRHPQPRDLERTRQIRRQLEERYNIDLDGDSGRPSNVTEWGPVIPGIPILPNNNNNGDTE
jgi:outer membrane protein OmpA-like peptidoglycan-associated protein